MLRWMGIVIGALASVVGLVWILQGINVLPGSFMTGDPFWAGAGLIVLVIGLLLFYSSARRGG